MLLRFCQWLRNRDILRKNNNHIISSKVLDLQKHPWVGLSQTVIRKSGNECPSDTTAVNQLFMNFSEL